MIRLQGIFTALGGREILRGLDLSIDRNETYVLLGPSGAGKSVLLKHIVGLIHPDRGRIEIDGDDITDRRDAELGPVRRSIGYVFQSGALINWLTVAENIALPMREHTDMDDDAIGDKVQGLLDLVHLSNDGAKYPDEISGGMKKRVGIARALALDPPIVLFDEPTAGLDPIRARAIARVVATMRESLEVTSLIVTHNLGIAFEIADRIGFLEDGRITEEGTPDEVSASKNPFVVEFLADRAAEKHDA